MNRLKWWMVFLAAAAAGFVLLGFWGLVLGPFAAGGYFLWQRQRLVAELGTEEHRLAQFIAPKAVEKKPPFEALLKRAAAFKGAARFNAYAEARLALLENPQDAHAAVEAALISERPRDAAQAIGVCLANGRAAIAAALFVYVVESRTALTLSPAQWEALGPPLMAQGAFMEAAWAMHAGALLANDPLGAQKRLIEVADKAGEANQPQVAIKLYQTLLAKYPASQYAEFVRDSIKRQEQRLRIPRTAGPG
jgi:hypothetical protein